MNQKLRFIGLLAFVVVVSFIIGCFPGAQKVKTFSDMTGKEKVTYAYQIYNAQHEDYVAMAKNPNLPEGQKKMLRAKKPILEKLQVLIPAFDRQVQAGAPSHTQEQQLYDLLNDLQAIVPLN